MTTRDTQAEATDLLQKLGLKEYEARCFVGLTQLDTGTAREVSEITDVPRTRIYDGMSVLEDQGLVETQQGSPKRFRAVSLDEAIETLRDHYEGHIEQLQDALETIDLVEESDDTPAQEVWTMTGDAGIENRTNQLLDSATDEIVLVIGDESLLTTELVSTLTEIETDVDLLIGALTEPLQDHIQETVPGATTFRSGLEWLHGENASEDETAIGRLLLVDRSSILVSTIMPETKDEQAILGDGFGNGLVVIARRLMAQGLVTGQDPGT